MDLVRLLFPYLMGIRVDRVLLKGSTVRIEAAAVAPVASCPGCGFTSGRLHSGYVRRLADSSVGGREVQIQLAVHRFFCRQPPCPRKTFAEQVEGLSVRYGRQTVLAHDALQLPPRVRNGVESVHHRSMTCSG